VLAHLALVRQDTAEALRRFRSLPDTLCARCYADRLTRVKLLVARRRDREAFPQLGEAMVGNESPFEVLFAFERGRVAERLGEGPVAVRAYQFVIDAWARGDPEVQTYVAEARRGLARVASGRR
jgi:serine/threonine-protein kinase